jgi:hypothetical protein
MNTKVLFKTVRHMPRAQQPKPVMVRVASALDMLLCGALHFSRQPLLLMLLICLLACFPCLTAGGKPRIDAVCWAGLML